MSNNNTTAISRASVNPQCKQWKKIRSNVVLALAESFEGRSRMVEQQIYERSCVNIDAYKNLAIFILQQTPSEDLNGFVRKHQEAYHKKIQDMYTEDHTISDDMLRNMFAVRKEKVDDRYALSRCGNCGSTDVTITVAQIRSADEGMSSLCRCNECGAKWTTR